MNKFEKIILNKPLIDKNIVINKVNNICIDYNFKLLKLSIIFLNDDELKEINIKYLNKDYLTDIISFNLGNKNTIDGELFISVERVEENAKDLNIKHIDELLRVILHGVLHFVGKNDETQEEKDEMRKLENYYLNQ